TVRACNVNNQCSTTVSAVAVTPDGPLFEVVKTGSNTFSIRVGNVYSAGIEEKVNGVWTTLRSLSPMGAIQTFNYSRPAGRYTFRLYNCYPAAPGCSTSADKDVLLDGSSSSSSSSSSSMPVPAAPTVTASFRGASVAVSWSQPTHATSYQLQRNGQDVDFTSNPHIDLAIDGNRTYTYTVKACNSNNQCSAASSAVVVIPDAPLFEVVKTGSNTFSIYVGYVYQWWVEEKVNGVWTMLLSESAIGTTKTFNYTR